MKKMTYGLIGLIIAGILVWGFIFSLQNLKGVGPALQNPPEDISTLIPSLPSTQSQQADRTSPTTDSPLQTPNGFGISIYAKNLVDPRVLVQAPDGVMLTSVTSEGKIVALPDANGDGVADNNVTVIKGLNKPHGMAFNCPDPNSSSTCQLYIGETDKVTRYFYDTQKMKATFDKKITDLSGEGRHFTRTLQFLNPPSNDQLLVSIGSDCDACREQDSTRGTIMLLDTTTGKLKPYATGLRNSVFMTHDPYFEKIFATEMGRDYLGNNVPPDEINLIEEGKNYGWPICYGQNIHDDDFDHNTYIRNPCEAPFETPSVIDLQAHSAPLGLAFFPVSETVNGQKNTWPEEYRGNLLVTFHGSWNRSVPTGYKIVLMKTHPNINDQTLTFDSPEDFMTGWLTPDGALGRPVDIFIKPDGQILVSDDKAGVVYLLRYSNE